MLRLHRILVFVVFMAVISVLPLSAMAQDGGGYRLDAPKYAARGRLPVGTYDFVIGAGSDRPLNATVWYPALNPDRVEEAVTYDMGLGEIAPQYNEWYGQAIRDAAPDPSRGPYPLVIFSPGWGGSRFMGSYLCDHLASYGFVIIGIEHPSNALADLFADYDEVVANTYRSIIDRPRDVTTTLDYADAMTYDGLMLGMINMDKVAVMGVSFGGYTAFAAAGAQLDMRYFGEWCAVQRDQSECQMIVDNQSEMAEMIDLNAVPEALWPSLGDTRVDAIIPIIPGGGRYIGPEGFKSVTVPTMILYSTHDETVAQSETDMILESVSAPKTLVGFQGADHNLNGGFCPDAWLSIGYDFCYDSVWDMDRLHDLMNHFVTAFLVSRLQEDSLADTHLKPAIVDFAGIAYQTTDFVD